MRLLFISFILGLSVCLQAQNFPVRPANYRAVNDFAEMIDAASAAEIEQELQAFNDTAGVQIALITVQNLNGWSIEQYGQQLAEKWGIGHAETNQGLLLLLAKEERKVRFEVGYGLEERLPDLYCQEVIDQILIPAFKQGQFGEGCLQGLQMVQLQLQGLPNEISAERSLSAQAFIAENKAFDWVVYSFLIVVFLSALYEGLTIRPYPWINFFMALLGAPIYLFMVVGLCFLPVYLIASKSFAYTPTLVWTQFGIYLALLLFWAIYWRGQFAEMTKDSFKGGGGGGSGRYSSSGYSSYSGSSSSSYSSSSSSSSWGGGSFGGGGASGGW
ncbi:TPM domain-containing protein [Saprospira grandis]|uniref:TPM domain-containing protein n=1 Tax=Saprospira grandis (strain Lewin) TaxID=984262 RepID=H6KYZ9_SAPGL|nr:TPM domain-containing protein [Saprospira grandis]AFC23283.1 hypothetical protein SGRA_0544 [Saprospira grandis str. Lewin]